MDFDIGFWEPRNSFVVPISELDDAANLLNEAVTALLAGDVESAWSHIKAADLPVLRSYADRIMGRESVEIHRRRRIETGMTVAVRDKMRMPSSEVIGALYRRDGWRCRFCGCKVVPAEIRRQMRKLASGCIPWGSTEGYHAAFYAMTAVADHVVPHSSGGTSDPDNLVTACWPCNFGRMNYSLEEVGLIDPRTRPPILDDWDGLTRLKSSVPRLAVESAVTKATSSRKKVELGYEDWQSMFEGHQPGVFAELTKFLDSCGELGVSWEVNKVLVIRLKAGGKSPTIIGIEPDGQVYIPWFLDGQKDAFRICAERIAEGLPSAVVYETPKTWSIKDRSGARIEARALVAAQDSVLAGFKLLREALLKPTASGDCPTTPA